MVYAGIDLGGTNIKVGIVDENGTILGESSKPTLVGRPFEDIAHDMILCIMNSLNQCGKSESELESIGIGIPGIADPKTGMIVFCPNLGWRDIALREELQKYIKKPVYIDNDATVAGYAESVSGVSRGCSSSVFLTLGTGLGGGIVINGKPWNGSHGVGSELGHMTLAVDGVPCTCGNNGCAERYCSATAIIRMAKQSCLAYPDSMIVKLAGSIEDISARHVFDAAKAQDEVAMRIFDRYTDYLAMMVNNVCAFLDPDMVILGGGVSHAGAFLLEAVQKKLMRYRLYKSLPAARLELAQLGNEAGIIGAALLGKAYQS
ncbi:MAG: ROK family glucokinase [Clostridia bacterium]|nr:ROK family glucokinase [Clostridia bacterium]